MGNALETLRRLRKRETYESRGPAFVRPGARGEAALTREAFFNALRAAQARVGREYASGLLERLSEDEQRSMLDAEEQMDAAARAGDFETAEEALEEWERAWLEVTRRKP